MELSDKKKRVSITPTKEVVKQIDAIAERLGMSRAAVCNMLIMTSLESYNKLLQMNPEQLEVVTRVLKED